MFYIDTNNRLATDSEDLEDLHAFARRLRIPRVKFSSGYYGLSRRTRSAAIELGAVPVDTVAPYSDMQRPLSWQQLAQARLVTYTAFGYPESYMNALTKARRALQSGKIPEPKYLGNGKWFVASFSNAHRDTPVGYECVPQAGRCACLNYPKSRYTAVACCHQEAAKLTEDRRNNVHWLQEQGDTERQ